MCCSIRYDVQWKCSCNLMPVYAFVSHTTFCFLIGIFIRPRCKRIDSNAFATCQENGCSEIKERILSRTRSSCSLHLHTSQSKLLSVHCHETEQSSMGPPLTKETSSFQIGKTYSEEDETKASLPATTRPDTSLPFTNHMIKSNRDHFQLQTLTWPNSH